MPKFTSILVLRHRADSADDAADVALAAGNHLIETFNDDESIDLAHGIRAIRGDEAAVVPVALLHALINATERAAEEAYRDWDSLRRGDKHDREAAREYRANEREWDSAARKALRLLRATEPRKRATKIERENAARVAAAGESLIEHMRAAAAAKA